MSYPPEWSTLGKAVSGMVPIGGESDPPYKITASKVAVSLEQEWIPIDDEKNPCPRGTKVQLLSAGGLPCYEVYNGNPFYTDWFPIPKRRKIA